MTMRHAMVVDDSRATRSILKRILTGLNFEVTEASNGREALARLKEGTQYELALVDWNMPVMDGYEFVRAVRADSVYQGICIMMVTTESEASQMVKALAAGANEYVMKPFTKEIILDKLQLLGIT